MSFLLALLMGPVFASECRHTHDKFACVEFVDNYDGDTMTVTIPKVHAFFGSHAKVRVRGVDSPEIESDNDCERKAAQKVKAHVHKLLAAANRVDLVHTGRDKYFRILADVEYDGQSLTKKLLDEGWAVSYNGETKPVTNWCHSHALAIEDER